MRETAYGLRLREENWKGPVLVRLASATEKFKKLGGVKVLKLFRGPKQRGGGSSCAFGLGIGVFLGFYG